MAATRKKPSKKIFYPHQAEGFRYTLQEQHPALFMEMRLGKTLIAIRRCKMYSRRGKILVVAPNSALPSWEKDAVGEDCAVVNMSGWPSMRINMELGCLDDYIAHGAAFGDRTVFYLINKEFAVRKGLWSFDKGWDAVVLDESTFIKSPTTKTTKYFLSQFRNVPHRWILTGTPWPEGEEEVYCQLKFLGHDLLGQPDYWHFRNNHMTQRPYGGWGIKSRSREKVFEEVGKRALIMRRKDVQMAEIKVREVRTFSLPEDVRKIYDKAEEDFVLEIPGMERVETVWVVAQYQWLRQMCGGFAQHELLWDGKIKELQALKKGELKNERIVVWCNYNDEVKAISKVFGRSAWSITGKVPPRERWIRVCAWSKCAAGILVVQQKCAQTGLDLSAADTAIYFSTPVRQMERSQTEDRIVSMDKIKEGRPLLIMDFVVENSVDEDVQKAIARKERRSDFGMSQALISYMRERRGKCR